MSKLLVFRGSSLKGRPLVYVPSFMDLLANKPNSWDVKEAKRRCKWFGDRYSYIPSFHYRQKLHSLTNQLAKLKQNSPFKAKTAC
jgi:hypothetical protein